jgi:choline dehydrogenase
MAATEILKQEEKIQVHYDFIVCGSGSTGSVVTAQLSENSSEEVRLIEADSRDDVTEL